jgi:glycolate oxidase FAD binding subunit
VSLKVLPKPETETTLVLHELTLRDSVTAMSAALGSPFEVTGAAFVDGLVHIRIEGFEASVAYRAGKLRDLLEKFGEITQTEDTASAAQWRDIRDVKCFADHDAVTRVSIKPSAAPEFAESLQQTLGADLAMDWGGGLMWFAVTETEGATHKALQELSAGARGHATLIKGPASMRADVPVFQPENPTVTALSQGLRAKFDPRGILNAGLMG